MVKTITVHQLGGEDLSEGGDVEGDGGVGVGGEGYTVLGQLVVVSVGCVEGDGDIVRREGGDVDVEGRLGSGGKGDVGGTQ